MKPILFNSDAVRAILAGKKTQTRRVCKVSSRAMNIDNKSCYQVAYPSSNLYGVCADFYDKNGFWLGASKPAYQPGEILYVRETWGDYRENSEDGEGYYTIYRADYPEGAETYKAGEDEFGKEIICDLPKWHPSIHMPKEAARIFLRVTRVWVDRLQNIQSMDAIAEGAEAEWHRNDCGDAIYTKTPIDTFAEIWDKTIKPGDIERYGWYANPWVWVIEFERIEKGEDGMEKITQEELKEILEKHKKWLRGEKGGERADLRCADLRNVNLRGVDLRCAVLCKTDLRDANLEGARLTDAVLQGANLRGTNLQGTALYDVDIRGADLDFSCLPLWCGSLSAHFDDRQLKQIAYHLVRAGLHSKNASPETKRELAKLIDFANGFHRVDECGKIKWEEETDKEKTE